MTRGNYPSWGLPAVYVAAISLLSEAVALTAFGLVRRWEEVAPMWLPFIGGRPVRPRGAIVAATMSSIALMLIWTVGFWDVWTGDQAHQMTSRQWAEVFALCYGPLKLWGPALLTLTWAYDRQSRARRGRTSTVGDRPARLGWAVMNLMVRSARSIRLRRAIPRQRLWTPTASECRTEACSEGASAWLRPSVAVSLATLLSQSRAQRCLHANAGNRGGHIMALRVPKVELPTELSEGMIKQFGAVPEPIQATWHNPKVAQANLDYGAKAATWDAAEESLKSFAHMAVAAQVGCSWCLDVGYFQAQHQDLDLDKASQVPRWRESEVFTPLERDVLEYAEAMTNTPPSVTDELSAGLLDRLGPAALVELTAFIAFANLATRNNTALGITSQGFSASCEVPLAVRADGPSPRSGV